MRLFRYLWLNAFVVLFYEILFFGGDIIPLGTGCVFGDDLWKNFKDNSRFCSCCLGRGRHNNLPMFYFNVYYLKKYEGR